MNKKDYKKEFKDLYAPKCEPDVIGVPPMYFIMTDGFGNPNDENGEYQRAVELLYALSYTIKMSIKNGNAPKNYFEYVVPPLEGLWWLNSDNKIDFSDKQKYCWTSMIRQPEFVTKEFFVWACNEVKLKKPHIDISKARLELFDEGLCVQCMHIGPFDNEPQTLSKIEGYIVNNNLINDVGGELHGKTRRHHEIYLNDPRKIDNTKMKTILRVPVRRNK